MNGYLDMFIRNILDVEKFSSLFDISTDSDFINN